ncbi:hypothetical protein GCM10007973_08540 [Polymorphobacter multimanifer]|nr:hypothetical protein GCM10007973_08540 [Polymorphobacter multimanifer]
MEPSRILHYLPENYQAAGARQDGPLLALLAAMDAMHEQVEALLQDIDTIVSPHAAPNDALVLLMASWLGLDRYLDGTADSPGKGTPSFRAGTRQLRLLEAETARLGRARGTRGALTRQLELATGLTGFEINDDDGRPCHLDVRAPAAARPLAKLVERIIEGERPAHATWSIEFAEAPNALDPAPDPAPEPVPTPAPEASEP